MSDNDLFAIPARARSSDPATSQKAAKAIEPHTPTIRFLVEEFAKRRGREGFIDEDLSAAFAAEVVSSYRTRRAELTDINVILDSGRRRANSGGQECIVWVHRDFVPQPPMEREIGPRPKADEVAAALRLLEDHAIQMKREGRMVANALIEAVQTIRRSRA